MLKNLNPIDSLPVMAWLNSYLLKSLVPSTIAMVESLNVMGAAMQFIENNNNKNEKIGLRENIIFYKGL